MKVARAAFTSAALHASCQGAARGRCETRGLCSCPRVCEVVMRGHLRVHGFVLLQTDGVSEGLAADFTCERPSAAVRPADVHLQSVRC